MADEDAAPSDTPVFKKRQVGARAKVVSIQSDIGSDTEAEERRNDRYACF